MKSNELKAVIIGAGWAGEGHTKALQHYGVDVAAICARKADVVQKVASQLGVSEASTDWQKSLLEIKPDIVAVTTPAILRTEVIELAAQLECHILCEKPLATTAEEAGRLYAIVKEAGVKHAFAATHLFGQKNVHGASSRVERCGPEPFLAFKRGAGEEQDPNPLGR